jgi:hypothetical protein
MFMNPPQSLLDEAVALASLKFESISFTSQSSFLRQLVALTYRELLNVRRDTAALGMRFGSTIFLCILFGVIFLNSGSKL